MHLVEPHWSGIHFSSGHLRRKARFAGRSPQASSLGRTGSRASTCHCRRSSTNRSVNSASRAAAWPRCSNELGAFRLCKTARMALPRRPLDLPGHGLERLLLNIEILEKSAQASCLPQLGPQGPSHSWLIKYIANGRLKKDQQDAAARHLRGERSILKAGY